MPLNTFEKLYMWSVLFKNTLVKVVTDIYVDNYLLLRIKLMIEELNDETLHHIGGGYWSHAAIAIAILDASYDFYQGYRSTRR